VSKRLVKAAAFQEVSQLGIDWGRQREGKNAYAFRNRLQSGQMACRIPRVPGSIRDDLKPLFQSDN
jgi:hypothetical protein